MILKDIFGKIRRFGQGRLHAIRHRKDSSQWGIPTPCLHFYAPSPNVEKSTEIQRLAIFYSGDGGWANLTAHVSLSLQHENIPVAGIDSMHYFWNEMSAEKSSAQLSALMEKLVNLWSAKEFVMIGYSMGADVLPIIVRHLPEKDRQKISRMILMSPSHFAYLKFRFLGWLGFCPPAGVGTEILPILQELSKEFPIACFAGLTETESLAHDLPEKIGRTILLPGGHHYAGDYVTLSDMIVTEISS